MTSPGEWWRRVTAAAKDKKSLCLTTMTKARGDHLAGGPRRAEVEAEVIRATTHDERSVDYKSARRVFGWANAAPSSFLNPTMWIIARRAERTRSWAVALKSLLLAHGLLRCSDDAPPTARLGRLPFDLSDFRDRSSSSSGFSAFVCAYFRFLDYRSHFYAQKPVKGATFTTIPAARPSDEEETEPDADLSELERLQALLDHQLQIRPYADGMRVRLILEAMDWVAIEIFEVYSSICDRISHFLAGIVGSKSSKTTRSPASEDRKRRGTLGLRVLRRAAAQNSQIAAYFDLCRSLGVLNAAEPPAVQSISEEDMAELEQLLVDDFPVTEAEEEAEAGEREDKEAGGDSGTVITRSWVVFDEGEAHSAKEEMEGHFWNPDLCCSPEPSSVWASVVKPRRGGLRKGKADSIELIGLIYP
ncbi:putative clathrin assembly protein At1g25240 [Musa acuminata AAA Group]|uniref:putative clathrin assembly protein At1g25240 n=1 Tax=Musa acuminata AAA Group TaxID=214697 RepID=UPI0031CE47CB